MNRSNNQGQDNGYERGLVVLYSKAHYIAYSLHNNLHPFDIRSYVPFSVATREATLGTLQTPPPHPTGHGLSHGISQRPPPSPLQEQSIGLERAQGAATKTLDSNLATNSRSTRSWKLVRTGCRHSLPIMFSFPQLISSGSGSGREFVTFTHTFGQRFLVHSGNPPGS